jgi:hypothetical protein
MVEPLEVNYKELQHLVSERALKNETVLLNMGPLLLAHAKYCGCYSTRWRVIVSVFLISVSSIQASKNMEAKRWELAEVMTDMQLSQQYRQ